MKLDCVLTAVNEKPLYLDFIPYFIKMWNKLYPMVDIKILLIANSIPQKLTVYKENIILFEPIKDISTSFISQYIRLLYPALLNYNGGVMITDIDIVPMNRTYYNQNIKYFKDDAFIHFRGNSLFGYNQISMCYNVAYPLVWKKIFNINSIEEIKKRMIDKYSNICYINENPTANPSWFTDQIDLFRYLMRWNKSTGNLFFLNDKDTAFNRLCRSQLFDLSDMTIQQNILEGRYSDYHCLRPFQKYENINNKIHELL